MAVFIRTRRVGAHIDGRQLERELAIRHLEAKRLAELAGLSEDVVSRARAGERISLASLYAIGAALEAVPVRGSLITSLVADQKRTAQGSTSGAVHAQEADSGRPLAAQA